MMQGNQFDTIYHEHFSYFSLLTVDRIFAAHGLRLFDVEELATHGGSIRIFAGHREQSRTSTERVESLKRVEMEFGLHDLAVYRSHFGFPNFFVPFITNTTTRMHSMMRLLEKATDERGSKMFLFKVFPAFTASERPKADGHMLREVWQRVGHPPLSLI